MESTDFIKANATAIRMAANAKLGFAVKLSPLKRLRILRRMAKDLSGDVQMTKFLKETNRDRFSPDAGRYARELRSKMRGLDAINRDVADIKSKNPVVSVMKKRLVKSNRKTFHKKYQSGKRQANISKRVQSKPAGPNKKKKKFFTRKNKTLLGVGIGGLAIGKMTGSRKPEAKVHNENNQYW